MTTKEIPVEVSGLIKDCIRIERNACARLMAAALCGGSDAEFEQM